jgi:RNA polymerase sigma-70 factor (ECF subfamily)
MNRSELDPLVEAAREGDTEAFDELVRRTYGDVFKLAVRLTGNETDADDVVQDTYVRAFRGLRRFRGDAQFSTWLYRIASNCASSFTARRSRQRCDSLSEAGELIQTNPDQDPTLQAEASTLRQTIERALEQLPQRLRAVVVLKHLDDLSHREIAERLGISESATKVRLHRARNTLRRILPLSAEHEDADSDDAMVAQIFSLDEHRASTEAKIDQRAAGE